MSDDITPIFQEPAAKPPGDFTTKHRMQVHRYESHLKEIFCSCGWSAGPRRKIVFKADVEKIWREHLDVPTDPED